MLVTQLKFLNSNPDQARDGCPTAGSATARATQTPEEDAYLWGFGVVGKLWGLLRFRVLGFREILGL